MQTETYVDGAPETVTTNLQTPQPGQNSKQVLKIGEAEQILIVSYLLKMPFGTSGRYTNAYKRFRAIGVSGSPQIPGQIVFFCTECR